MPVATLRARVVAVRRLATGDPVRLDGRAVTAEYFRVFDVGVQLGGTFQPRDVEPGNENVVAIDPEWFVGLPTELHLLPAGVRAVLAAHPLDFLYGSMAADISLAKKYVPEGRHSGRVACTADHVWPGCKGGALQFASGPFESSSDTSETAEEESE